MSGFQGRHWRMPEAILVSIRDDPGSQSGYRPLCISFLDPSGAGRALALRSILRQPRSQFPVQAG
jgi:hypothetical protein